MSEPTALPPDPIPAGPNAPPLGRLPQRLRGRLAALSMVGAALVSLPVLQLVRYQSAELETLSAGRAGLDPVARTAHLQRSLLAHRDLAAHVLRGVAGLEPERMLRQNEVDARMVALMVALAGGGWDLATSESEAQREDWLRLARQIQARSIDAPGSDRGHRLLIEQGLQIIDLLAVAEAEPARAGRSNGLGPALGATMSAVHAIPRLVWQIAALTATEDPRDSEARQRQMATVEASLARTLGRLEKSLGSPSAGTTDEHSSRTALAPAAAAAGAAVQRYFTLLASPAGDGVETRSAADEAVMSQWRLFDAAHAVAHSILADRTSAILRERSWLVIGLVAGALTASLLALSLSRGLRLLQQAEQMRRDEAAAPPRRTAGRRAEAGRLMERLRQSEAAATDGPGAQAPQADQHAKPPAG